MLKSGVNLGDIYKLPFKAAANEAGFQLSIYINLLLFP